MAARSKAASIVPTATDQRAVEAQARETARMTSSLTSLGLGYGPLDKLDTEKEEPDLGHGPLQKRRREKSLVQECRAGTGPRHMDLQADWRPQGCC